MITGLRRRAEAKVRRALLSPAGWLRSLVLTCPYPIVRLGSEYGGWHVVDEPALHGGQVALCGAGEDVSFDLALQARYECRVLIVDPTPRAVAHFTGLLSAAREGSSFAINNTSENYDFSGVDFERVTFAEFALWTEDTTLEFWEPENPSHVSYSAVNLQRTSRAIRVPARSLSSLLGRSIADLVLLKLDIEGAEVPVLRQLLASGELPRQVLVEFDEINFPTRENIDAVKQTVKLMLDSGYMLAHFDGRANCLFFRG